MSPPETPEIRHLTPAEHDGWYPLWRAYQEFYEVDIPAEVSAVTWRRLLDPSEPMFGALAWSGGRAVGLVHWLLHRSCWTIGNYCYLQDLFVWREERSRGIGRKLIDHVTLAAEVSKCSRVYWLTHETNSKAMLLYDRVAERSGFVQYRKLLK
jgi:GNAT superfamily N-acetyltransferase